MFFLMWNEIFNGIGEYTSVRTHGLTLVRTHGLTLLQCVLSQVWELVANQSHAHRFAQSFNHSLVSEYKYDIGTKTHVPNWILCKAADLSWQPVLGKGVCSDSNETVQQLQMAVLKSLETMSGMFLNQLQPKFAANLIANEIFESHVVTSVARVSLIFPCIFFWAICLCKQWPTVLLTNRP